MNVVGTVRPMAHPAPAWAAWERGGAYCGRASLCHHAKLLPEVKSSRPEHQVPDVWRRHHFKAWWWNIGHSPWILAWRERKRPHAKAAPWNPQGSDRLTGNK